MTQKNIVSEKLKVSIVNYLSGKREECDVALLTAWLEESGDNSKLFSQLVDLWEADQMAGREKNFNSDKAWARLESKMNRKKDRFVLFRQIGKYAAVFILALFLGGLGYSWLQPQFNSGFSSSAIVEYTAPYGSKTSLKLTDGSLVWLNAGTTLRYNQRFGNRNREVELSGEAYFEVAKNKTLPFTVNAKEISVTALGTKFNVKAYPDETAIQTILLEGAVKLQNHTTGKPSEVFLKAGQKALFSPTSNQFTVLTSTDASEVSWTTDKWVIKNTRLGELAKLLERRYNIDFKFSEERIKEYEFGGTIQGETIEQVLTAISYSAPLKYKIINKHVSLSIDENKIKTYETLLNEQ
ncbi:FecR family protein [Gaoshiqia sp. Z1-71]|uniref:FecR family protein n=1 Tax=Gaoshiqia hydrogeniformans TaxID=3290090 RepID=UPI003BF87016